MACALLVILVGCCQQRPATAATAPREGLASRNHAVAEAKPPDPSRKTTNIVGECIGQSLHDCRAWLQPLEGPVGLAQAQNYGLRTCGALTQTHFMAVVIASLVCNSKKLLIC